MIVDAADVSAACQVEFVGQFVAPSERYLLAHGAD